MKIVRASRLSSSGGGCGALFEDFCFEPAIDSCRSFGESESSDPASDISESTCAGETAGISSVRLFLGLRSGAGRSGVASASASLRFGLSAATGY